MNSLIVKILNSGKAENFKVLLKVKEALLDKQEIEFIAWVDTYIKSYSSLPPKEICEQKFEAYKYSSPEIVGETIEACYERFVNERSVQRMGAELSDFGARLANEGLIDPTDLVQRLYRYIKVSNRIAPMSSYDLDTLSNVRRIETGYKALDKSLGGGITEGEVMLLAARPNVGKTTALVNLAYDAINQRGHRVLFISAETPANDIASKFYGVHAKINPRNIGKFKELTSDEQKDVLEAQAYYKSVNLLDLCKDTNVSAGDIREMLLGQDVIGSYDLICLDATYMVESVSSYTDMYQSLASVVKHLMATAHMSKCPMVMTSQLSRAGADQADLESIGGTDEFGKAADYVAALKRRFDNGISYIDFNLLKSRGGPLGIKWSMAESYHGLTLKEL